MKIFENEQVICCDIDDTLVLWSPDAPGKRIKIPCAYSLHSDFDLAVHEPHVRLVRERLERGAIMIVWSQGGHKWARKVLESLGLLHENVHVYSKPIAYIDDKPCERWMGDRVYLPPDSPWKPQTGGHNE